MKLLFINLLWILVVCACDAQQHIIRATTNHTSGNGTTIQLDIPDIQYEFPTVMNKGVLAVKPEIRNALERAHPLHPGVPDIPYLTALIAIPSNTIPKVEITGQKFYVRTQQNIFPVQTSAKDAKNIQPKSNPVSTNPTQLIEFGTPGVMRGMYVVPVTIHPLQYNPVNREMKVYTSLKFTLHAGEMKTTEGRTPISTNNAESPAWEALAKPVILNYTDGLKWRTQAAQKSPGHPKIILQAGQQRVKMFVNHNGVFRITGRDLQTIFANSGVSLSSVDPTTFHLFLFHPDTVEIPIYLTGAADHSFDTGDTLEFYGHMHYGEEGQYYDYFTDDNAYWLTWGDQEKQKLYTPYVATSNAAEQHWYTKTDHYEQDKIFYVGSTNTNTAENFISDPVPGKGWYWYAFDAVVKSQNTFNLPFTIGGLPDVPNNATLRMNLQGAFGDTNVNQHNVEVWLNGDSLGDIVFGEWQDTVATISLPCKKLRNGVNDLSLVSVQPASVPFDLVYLGYIEVMTPREYVFTGDSLEFSTSSGGITNFTLQDVRSPSITVFNSTTEKIPALLSSTGGTFVRLEARGPFDSRYVRMEIEDSVFAASPFSRGFNVMEVDSTSGQVITYRRFDTYAYQDSSTAMVNFINSVPNGEFLLFATCDEATSNLTTAARSAIQSLGSTQIMAMKPNDSWAFVCKKGDASFTPTEDLSPAGTGGAHVVATISTALQQSWKFVFQDSTIGGSSYIAERSDSITAPHLMEVRSAPTLLSATNAADYIIITHRKFIAQANTLAQYRAQHNGYRTAVVDIEDIYDQFNGGVMREVPIRDFLQYAYHSWQAPAPAIVMLLGDATTDARLSASGDWRQMYIPSYGNPVSDYWFTCLDGADMFPEMMIGRLGESNTDTAQAVINKIINYEATPPQQWNKQFLFVTGGFNTIESVTFSYPVASVIAPYYILPSPVCGDTILVTRSDYSEPISTDKTAVIETAINNGVLWMNYFGHGASVNFDLDFGVPSDLTNGTRLPLFSSFACNAGAFAIGSGYCINEQYVNEPNNGFLAAWGTTGFGFVNEDQQMMETGYQMLAADSLIQIGRLITQAKIAFWAFYGNGANNFYDSIYARNEIMLQDLLGDPATTLALRVHPAIEIYDSDVVARGIQSIATDQDTAFFLRLEVFNDGFSSDSIFHILIQDAYPGGLFLDTVSAPVPCAAESILVAIPIHHNSGTHQLTVTLNFDNSLPQNYFANSIAQTSIVVYSSVSTILRPQNFGSMASNCQTNTLDVLIPQSGSANLKYYFQMDTSTSFSSPLFIASSPQMSPSIPMLQWQIPNTYTLRPNTTYYWQVRTFNPTNNSYSIWAPLTPSSFVPNGLPWQQISAPQFIQNGLDNLTVESDGVHLGTTLGIIRAESRGWYDLRNGGALRFSTFQLGNGPVINTNASTGLYLYVLADTAFALAQAKSFNTNHDSTASDSLVAFINSIPTGRVVIAVGDDEITQLLTNSARTALKMLGAKYTDSLIYTASVYGGAFRSSYALIGIKGAPPGGAIDEIWTPGGDSIDAKIDTTIPFHYLRGTITTPLIGPATVWNSAHCKVSLPANTSGKFTVYGFNQHTSKYDSLANINTTTGLADLSHVDPRTYHYIQLIGELDRQNINVEPVLNQWSTGFTGVPELTAYLPTLSITPNTVTQGSPAVIAADVYNVGCVTAKNILVQTTLQNSGVSVVGGTQTIDSLPPMAKTHVQMPITTSTVHGLQSVAFTIDPFDSIPELDKANNTLISSMYVQKDTTAPALIVTVDGRQIQNGDYVRPTPVIVVKIIDNNPLRQSNPSSIIINIDDSAYSAVKTPLHMTFDSVSAGNVKASATLNPNLLSSGQHILAVSGFDPSGNSAPPYTVTFVVNTTSSLQNVMNAPDPFPSNTNFTFQLTGETSPQSATIKIYSVAGRLLRALNVPPSSLRVGFNAIPWDGTDAEGNRMGNGVYIYKLIVRVPGQDLIETQKMAILR